MTDSEHHHAEHHDDVQNNAVIASAMRTSLIVIMLMGLPLIGVLIYLNLSKKESGSTEVEVTRPAQRAETEPKTHSIDVSDRKLNIPQ